MSTAIKRKEPSINTIIGERTVITGNLHLEGDIIIYGKIHGDIATDGTITVFSGAEIRGKLSGANLNIGGHVEGNISAAGKVALGDRAFLRGDINAGQIVIEDGAVFEGRCEMHFAHPVPPEVSGSPETTTPSESSSPVL